MRDVDLYALQFGDSHLFGRVVCHCFHLIWLACNEVVSKGRNMWIFSNKELS